MERHTRLSRAAVVLVAIALIASIAAAVWFASPDAPYVPNEDSGAALGTAAPAEDGTVAGGYQPSSTSTGISDISTARNNLSGNYYLTENITVTSLAHAGNDSDNTFTGTLDGNGKIITINAATNTSSLPTNGSQGGLFAILGGTVKNCVIVVKNFQAKWATGSSWANAGIIAGAGNTNAKVQNVKIVLEHSPTSMANGEDNAYASQYGGKSVNDSHMRLGGVFGNVIGDVTFDDVTVDNQTSGDYGFSTHGWRAEGSFFTHSDGFIHIGGFVGNMQSGSVTANRIKLAGNANAKFTAYHESTGSYRYNQSFIGGIIGYADNGGSTINGLIVTYPMANNFSAHNGNYNSACGIINGHADNGNQGTVTNAYCKEGIQDDYALSNGTSTTVNFFTTGTKDAEFTGATTIAFDGMTMHGPDKASEIVTKISQGGTESDVFEALLATDPSKEGTSTWVEANIVNATSTQAINFDAGRATSSTYSVVTDSAGSLTSVDGTTYNGTKIYDGNALTAPYILYGSKTVNAWTAASDDLINVNGGEAKVFSYDSNALSGHTTVAYNGTTYFIDGGTIYSPGNINVGGASQTFTLGNAFSYTITPISMSSVAVSVSETKLYEGEALLDEWLTVTSTDPSGIDGTAKWDEGQTLSTQTTTYNWTWTPNSDNYQSYSGTVELKVLEKQIVSIEVTKAPKTDYVAYDAFDSTDIEVTATYSDGTTAVLTNEYAFKIVGADGNEVEGGIDKLFVAYKEVTVYLLSGSEVTTTIRINVDYVRFAVEQKAYNKDITYGDSYQWNAADFYTWSDNTEVVETKMDFYEVGPDLTDDISGIATADAGTKFIGRVLGRAFYKGEEVPDAEYDNFIGINNPDEIASEVTLTIVPRKMEIKSSGIASGDYSGEPVDLRTLFTAQGVNDDVIDLSFDITLNNETCDEVRGAGTYSVTASLAESETNYTAEPVTITYTVTKLAIPKPQDAEEPIVYDGKEHDVTPTVPEYKVVNGTTAATDAGNYSFTIALTDKANTEWEGGSSDDITVTWSIIPMTIAGTVSAPTDLTYDGNAKEATFKLTSGELFNGDAVTIEYSGDNVNVSDGAITATAKLPVSGNYAWADDTAPSATFTISPKAVEIESIQELTKTYDGQEVDPRRLFPAPNGVDGQPIELTITVDGDKTILNAGTYTVTAKPTSANYAGACEVKYIIQKASPSVTVKVDTDTTYYSSQSLYDIAIEAEEPSVAGKIAWEEGQVLSAATTEYSWVFTPDDVDNYEIVTGKVTLKVENVTLNHIEVTKNPDKMSYVAYSDFDATGMIVTAYFDGAEARELGIEELTLSGNKNLQYGDGKATITITFQEKTATVTVDVTKMLIPVPKAQTGIVFDGELHTGIVEDEQWSQYYHVDAEERYAGTYTAVVNLNDVNNTAWEGTEDSEPKEIPWTIEHVTIEVTVNAESKTVEYGTAYSWDPYDFFAVEVTNSDLFEVKLDVFDDGSITDISTANVGEYSEGIFASVTRKDGVALEEQDLASFKFSQDITQLAMKVIVIAKTVEVALDENVDFAAYDGAKLSKEDLFGMFKLEMNIEDLAFEVDDVPYDAAEIVNAGEYTVKVVSANGNYNLTGTTEGVYKIAKATLTVTASAESEGLDTSDDLYAVPLNVKGVGVNGEEVRGTGVWAPGQSLSEGTNNYKFVFTPDQEFAVNYEVCEGECEIANVAQATLTGVSVKIVATKEYVAFDAFDRSSIAVEALYGEDRKQVTDYTLTFSIGAEDKLFAGTGITVTVTYTDGEVKQSTEFTIDVAKRAVAKPVVDTTVFDATGETITLPIAESEYYTIYGNTAIEPGRYVATVELNDPANTMWEDGSTDVVSIAWTISEPVTSDEVIADILAMEKVTWQNAEEFLDLEARYNALDESEQTAEATAKLATLKAQYDALRNAAFDDIEAAHEVTAKSLGRALAAAAAGLSAAAIALAIAKRRSI